MRVERSLQRVSPAALLGERGKLMLPDDVSCEAIRIRASSQLRIGYKINLTMRLLEGLGHLMRFQPAPPGCHRSSVRAQGMPEADLRLRGQPIEWAILHVDDLAAVPDTRFGALPKPKLPDQSPRKICQQRMLQVTLAPLLEFPDALRHQQPLEPIALGRQHLFNVLDRALEFLKIISASFLDLR